MRKMDSSFLVVFAVTFALVLGAGATLAWASSGCSGSVSGSSGAYTLVCAGDCAPDPGPCGISGTKPNKPTGLQVCVCDPNGPIPGTPSGECNLYLGWTTVGTAKVYTIVCVKDECPSTCTPDGTGGITVNPTTNVATGSGTTTCLCN
jgi:hypothetical protein